jgi:UDP-glucose 4-epimerase
MKSRVLVTGGSGFIGTYLCRKLIERGDSVTVIDLLPPKYRVNGVNYVIGDVRTPAQLDPLVSQADCVYHFAAIVSVAVCQQQPVESYQTNFQGTLNVLEAVRKFSLEQKRKIKIAFSSTAAVYGTLGDHLKPLKEEFVAERFSSFYAAQKHASEQAIALYHESYGIPAYVFRFFNVYGVGQDPSSPYSGVISVFTRLAREGKPLSLNGGGKQTRDFVSVIDVASACASILDQPDEKWKALPTNLGTSQTITIRQLGEKIVKISGKNLALVDTPAREGDVQHSKADITRAQTHLAFKPSVSVDDGLRAVMETQP